MSRTNPIGIDRMASCTLLFIEFGATSGVTDNGRLAGIDSDKADCAKQESSGKGAD
jgi:hypothetical protein